MQRLLLLLILPLLWLARPARAEIIDVGLSNWVTQVNAATTASTRATGCIDTRGFAYLAAAVKIDRDGSPVVTAAAMTCSAHFSSDCTDTIPMQLGACVDNVCTQFAPSWAIDADEGWAIRWDVAGHDYVSCSVSFTNGDAGDTVSVYTRKTKE